MTTEPKNAIEQKRSKATHRLRTAWDCSFQYLHQPKLGNHLWREIPFAIRHCLVLFGCFIVLVVILLWRGCDKDSQISGLAKYNQFLQMSFTTTGQSNAALLGSYLLDVHRLNGLNQEESNKILQLTQERDKAQLEAKTDRDSLAAWMILANSQNTNTPLTVRMDLISQQLTTLASHTNIDSEVVNLDLFVNESPVLPAPRRTQVFLGQSRTIQCRVGNTGTLPAKDMTLDVYIPLDLTNLIFTGWQPNALSRDSITHREIIGLNHLRVKAADLIGNGISFTTPPISISTNVASPRFSRREVEALGYRFTNEWTNMPPDSCFPFLPVRVFVYSEQSSTREFLIFFLY